MSNHPIYRALLQNVLETPQDDAPRLILADWLEENSFPERAEFIRVQCELAMGRCLDQEVMDFGYIMNGERVPPVAGLYCGRCRWCLLKKREKELFHRFGDTESIWGALVKYRRGFVAEITISCADWLQHGPALTQQTPLEKVTLSDKRPDPQDTEFTGYWNWYGRVRLEDWMRDSSSLPWPLFKRLAFDAWDGRDTCFYDSEIKAVEDLSIACLSWARSAPRPAPAVSCTMEATTDGRTWFPIRADGTSI